MSEAMLRFYEELNDFLPLNRRKTDFQVHFNGSRSIEDMIKALGVPPTEIDLILVNGKSVEFAYQLMDGDQVSVYPVFESLNIKTISRLRKKPLRRTKFIVDANLGDMAKYMRGLGLDVCFDPSLSDREVIRVSEDENRIILSKHRDLLKFRGVTHGILICPGAIGEQIKKIIDYLDLRDSIKPFSRCLVCNNTKRNVPKEGNTDRISPKSKAFCDQYAYCKSCNKSYLRETDLTKMKKVIDQVLDKPES